MKLFRFLAEKLKGIARRIKEREERLEEERRRADFARWLQQVIETTRRECGPFVTEAELRGLPDAYDGPRTDGTILELLKRLSVAYIREAGTVPPSKISEHDFIKKKYRNLS